MSSIVLPSTRERIIAKLTSLLNSHLAEQLVEQIYLQCSDKMFKPKVRNLVMSLDKSRDTFSATFHQQLMEGYITPKQAVSMNAFQRNPEAWTVEQAKIDEHNQQAIKNEKFRARSKDYKCPSCRLKDAYFYQMQNRSGDEGMTLHLECVPCGYKWQINT